MFDSCSTFPSLYLSDSTNLGNFNLLGPLNIMNHLQRLPIYNFSWAEKTTAATTVQHLTSLFTGLLIVNNLLYWIKLMDCSLVLNCFLFCDCQSSKNIKFVPSQCWIVIWHTAVVVAVQKSLLKKARTLRLQPKPEKANNSLSHTPPPRPSLFHTKINYHLPLAEVQLFLG